MDIYKKYIYKFRYLTLKEPYIILKQDEGPKLRHYISLLRDVTFEDGSYHTYYGEIKSILKSFTMYWTYILDDAIMEADRCSNIMTLEELMIMMDKTVSMQHERQVDFERQFLPITCAWEKKIYDDVQEKFRAFTVQLNEMKDALKRLDKQEKVDAFAKEHFSLSLKIKNEILVFTYDFISYVLSTNIDKIRVSIEEILNHSKNNLDMILNESELDVTNLMHQLYEKNKEHLSLSRQEFRSSVDLAEIERSMNVLRDKIKDSKHIPMQRIQEEFKYWQDRLEEFNQIDKTLKKIQSEEKKVLDQKKIFNSTKDTQIVPPKHKCWDEMKDRFEQTLKEIKQLKLNAAKALLTFFSVRGLDRIFYTDNIGKYYVDEYNHQNYVRDYNLQELHINCEGEFVDPKETNYFYDSTGRYILGDNGEKLYQSARCSSTYKMENETLVKQSKDCGHSEKINKKCRMQEHDPTQMVVLPDIKPIDIKGSLDTNVVKYIWDTFGHILTEVLHDVAETQTRNPIHDFAHKLLQYKYKYTAKEMQKKKEEAAMYRANICRDRLDKAKAKYKEWKDKQVKRRKPEESDDREERFAFDAHVAQQDFIRSLADYN